MKTIYNPTSLYSIRYETACLFLFLSLFEFVIWVMITTSMWIVVNVLLHAKICYTFINGLENPKNAWDGFINVPSIKAISKYIIHNIYVCFYQYRCYFILLSIVPTSFHNY